MNDWIGLTVGEVLAECNVDYRDVTLLDDPPGKLRSVSFAYHHNGQPVNVVLEFKFDPELFSKQREWRQSLVESQSVTKFYFSTEDLY